jgi:uncharacterized protein (TIGR02117 family)
MNLIKIFFRITGGLLLFIFGVMMLYLLAAVVLTLIPVNTNYEEPEEGIKIFIESNGAHADLTLPIVTEQVDWRAVIDPADFSTPPNPFTYISFGWGEKQFYTTVAHWEDLTLPVAAHALFLPSPAAIHVTYKIYEPQENQFTAALILTPEQYLQLTDYIISYFQKGPDNEVKIIDVYHYGNYDRFYHAYGSYTLFNTSNNWTNRALKELGVKTALWAPFDRSILYHRQNP